ncbi:MAG: BamA/TamA family outer membrane protein [Proteobacteria bacterium]|nr:BamA/TamA family outer membrane protein [Pseudomonadota bacterium]
MRAGRRGGGRFRPIGRALGLLLLLASSAARSADPQPYKAKLADTRDSALNEALQSTSDLLNLRKSAPVGPFGLIGRAQNDLNRLKIVLESVGYYQGSVSITIDSLPLDDPRLGEELSNRSAKDDAQVEVSFNLGPLYHLGTVELTGDVPPKAANSLQLKTGAPAVAADVLAAAGRVRQTLADNGYAYAKVDPPRAKENSSEKVLNVSIHATPGKRYQLGELHLTGLKTINESHVRKRLLIHSGDEYNASAIEVARRDLLAVGVFTQVNVELAPKPDPDGRVPLTIQFRERKPHAVGLTGAYSSDLGASVGVNWLKREITGNADSLALSADVINLGGGTASNGIGYDLNGKYSLPDWKTRDQTLQVQLGALKQSLEAYDQKAVTTGVSVIRKLSSIWSVSAGVAAEREQIIQESPPDAIESAAVGCTSNIVAPRPGTSEPRCTYNYTLLSLPLSATYNTTGQTSPLADAIKGLRTTLMLTPTFSLGHPSAKFVVTQLTASTYFDLQKLGLAHDPGRSILALRALGGLAAGATQFSLPPDQRFYAGGSGTIRGYRYQSVGPLFPDGNPIGGTAINAGTIEYRQRIGAALGFATFVDAGNVSRNLNPLKGDLKVGVGAGVRYYTPLGPLRVDFAVPLQKRKGPNVSNPDDSFEVYIGLGQAF